MSGQWRTVAGITPSAGWLRRSGRRSCCRSEAVWVDEGLFDESAIIRRVAGEGLILAGAGRALLLQLAHPAVARGVAAHSDFSHRSVDRLRATLTYVYAVLFGSRAEAQAVSRAVREIHTRVSGPGYDATDPALLVWVNATLVDTALLLYQAVFGPLSSGEVEQCCRQYRVLATAIGCPADVWPRTFADFSGYWQHMVGSLSVSETARVLAGALLWPTVPWPVRPALPVVRFITVGLLPEPIRAGYGYSWTHQQARRLEFGRQLTSAVYPHLPIRLRQAPKDHYLREMRGHSRQAMRVTQWIRRPVAAGASAGVDQRGECLEREVMSWPIRSRTSCCSTME